MEDFSGSDSHGQEKSEILRCAPRLPGTEHRFSADA